MEFCQIVLIDDDRLYTEVVKRRLCAFGFQNKVRVFLDGTPAIEYLNALSKDQNSKETILILLDLKMPVMDGHLFKMAGSPGVAPSYVDLESTRSPVDPPPVIGDTVSHL